MSYADVQFKWAAEAGGVAKVRYLLPTAHRRAVSNSLVLASKNGHTEIVRLFIDKRLSDIHDGAIDSALMHARVGRHIEIAELLLTKGRGIS